MNRRSLLKLLGFAPAAVVAAKYLPAIDIPADVPPPVGEIGSWTNIRFVTDEAVETLAKTMSSTRDYFLYRELMFGSRYKKPKRNDVLIVSNPDIQRSIREC